jgi:hypothetical protein
MSPSPGRRAVTEFDKRRAANIRLTTGYLAIPVEQVGGLMRTVGLRARSTCGWAILLTSAGRHATRGLTSR